MASKMVTDRVKSASSVTASLRTNGPQVATQLSALFEPQLKDGETVPDVAFLFELMARHLDDKTQLMAKADADHLKQLGERASAVGAREEEIEQLQEEVQALREIVTGLYSAHIAEGIGLAGAVSDDPQEIKTKLQTVVTGLASANLGPSRVPGASLDPAELVPSLQARLDDLNAAITVVATEHKETSASQTAKNKAMKDYDDTFTALAALTEHVYRTVGEHLLARDVRPSARRRGRTDVLDDDGGATP
ncbi:MAG: hypothetical protein AAFX99_33400 [Myxococcota bacterium]